MTTTTKPNNGILARASVLRKEVALEAPKKKTCPKCKHTKKIEQFGLRTHFPKPGSKMKVRVSTQSYCTDCRAGKKPVKVATKKLVTKPTPKKAPVKVTAKTAKPVTAGGKKKPSKKAPVKPVETIAPPVVQAPPETAPIAPAVTQAAPQAPKAETKVEQVVKAVPPTIRRKPLIIDVAEGETEEQAEARTLAF